MTALAPPRGRTTLTGGPWKGVRTTTDPFDDSPDQLVDAQNGYIPDPAGGSAFYARRGFRLCNPSLPLAGRGQGVYSHTDLTGTTYNFIAAGGQLYRVDAAIVTFTKVTPAGITLDPATPRVYFTTFDGQLIISDGANRPWIASNLSSTPITGTPIDYDGAGVTWSAFGQPVVYGGSLFVTLNQVGGVKRRTDISWSNPGDPTTGWQQPDFDFNWTLEQTASTPLFALLATNASLFYFRDKSIGAITGVPGPGLANSATHDAVSDQVGTLQSATVQLFGNTIFFCDQIGRPWALPVTWYAAAEARLIPLYLQMRSIVDTSTYQYPSATAQVELATIEPTLQLYLAAIWSPVPGAAADPLELYVFDGKSMTYFGRWSIGSQGALVGIEAMGILNDDYGDGTLVIIGTNPSPPAVDVLGTESILPITTEEITPDTVELLLTAGATAAVGYVWAQNASTDTGLDLITEDRLNELVTEDGLNELVTEETSISYLDNGETPTISATTTRFGYSANRVWNWDQAVIVAESPDRCAVSVMTTAMPTTLEGSPVPSPSQDTTYRLVCGVEAQGRGIEVTVSPTVVNDRWGLQQVSVIGVPSMAGVEDP